MTADDALDIDSGVVDWCYDGTLAERGWSDGDIRTFAHLLLRPCTWCGAQPGQRCRTGAGTPIERLDGQHMVRRQIAQD